MSLSCAVFYFSFLVVSVPCALANEGVLDKIKAGLQNARNYLETARDIADLVSKSLRSGQTQKKRGDDANFGDNQYNKPFEPTNLVSTFFRLLGLDSKKVTAVAINSFIFFAQMISEFFKITPKVEHARSLNKDDSFMEPIRLITESDNEKVQNLFQQAKDKNLPDRLALYANNLESSCVKLLLCKTSPIIWAAQKSLKNNSRSVKRDLTSWLPSIEEFEDYSDVCDDKHTDCPIPYQNL
ncbi:uncharacterized protein LOC106639985 [Copidosoma floridanum]|uniref:uncharacterized protein LOC106639985 n=1 Tax=Copidosoma floridanum TaxID=29053 RepID=UPI0006C98FC1|nr:uncharacterized protein LOC106639985 [Copidosoma floridanum]